MSKSLLDPSFEYHNAAQSTKPGYLSERFAKYKEQMMNGHDEKTIDWFRREWESDRQAQDEYLQWLDRMDAEINIPKQVPYAEDE